MLTRWAEENAKTPLNEYPRPTLTRDQWMNLNGLWRYKVTTLDAPMPQGSPADWDGDILVPFCIESELSGVQRAFSPAERLWYQREFDLEDASQRTLLNFGAVDYDCAVWINSALAGTHRGGFDAFTLDISPYVDQGANTLQVAVTDPSSRGDQPRGKQHLKPNGIWYTTVSGIWQTVWIEQVPLDAHIEELRVEPALACDAITVVAFLHRPSRDPGLAVNIVVSLNSQEISRTIARPDREVRIELPDPQLWNPDTPILYDLHVELLRIDDPLPVEDQQTLERQTPLRGTTEAALYATADLQKAAVIDSVGSYFGLRHIELGKHPAGGHPAMLLNGKPLFQLGPLDQGWWPDGLHTPPSDAAMVYELEYLKDAGFNTVRKHIKVEPARYYYHCDRLGLLVWQDMPSGFLPAQFVAPNDEAEGLRHSRSVDGFEIELQRMIRGLKQHPCIVVWVLHNEGWGQFESARLTERIKSLDASRLVNATSGWLDVRAGDLIDRHDYNPVPTPPAADGLRALVVGEYGGAGWPVEGHQWDPSIRNWGYQTFHSLEDVQRAYQQFTDAIVAMQRNQGVCAAIYTQTSDVEGEVNGLLTYDRGVEKLSRDWLRKVHAPLYQVIGSAD